MRCMSEKCTIPGWPHRLIVPYNENGGKDLVGCIHRDPFHHRGPSCSFPCPMAEQGDTVKGICGETLEDLKPWGPFPERFVIA